jgi:hypothetical protein
MKKNKCIYNLTASSLFLISLLNISGCSNKNEVIEMSQTHFYNENYGVMPNQEADIMLAKESEIEKHPVEVYDKVSNPNYISIAQVEKEPLKPDEFIEGNWNPPKPKIFYKYMDDPNFYSEDELPENKLKVEGTKTMIIKKKDNSHLYSKND